MFQRIQKIMDTRQALDILHLSDDAFLEDAKASFRNLAKQYHPDKLNNSNRKINAHERMKEINLAFQILKGELKPKEKIILKQKKTRKTTKIKKTSTFHGLEALFKRIHKEFFKKTKVKKRKPSETFKKTKTTQTFVKKKKIFDSVLNKTIKSSLNINFEKSGQRFSSRTGSKQKINLKNNFLKYMELKQKIRSKRRYNNFEGFGPIEKISPISSIKKS